MGIVYTEITLKNAGDVANVGCGFIAEKDVRGITVTALVDTGAGTLVINEDVCRKLGLKITGLRNTTLADNGRVACKFTEPVQIQWKDRLSYCGALVLPDSTDVLLGAIPLEDMDLIVHPASQELRGAHGDDIVCLIK
ncbi:MAG: clan AA aspartic protease [Spirochaetaceae bacterium]|jgi:clan AA aspartic protease|nr:clan AA aspartic protease [Spirochaetaceae bacterium]